MEDNKINAFRDIFIAEINLALDGLLRDKIFTTDVFGRKKAVPIFFRDRDSKLIADTTPQSLVSIAFTGYDKADSVYWEQCGSKEVIEVDSDGNPIKYRIIGPADAVLMRYSISARSQHWDDMIAVDHALAKFFPVTHTLLDVDGFKTHMFRTGYQSVDDAQLGIFERNISLEIIGYLFPANCKNEIAYGIRSATLEVGTSADPDNDSVESVEIVDNC